MTSTTQALPIPKEAIDEAVRAALAEDLGSGDLTTEAVIPAERTARAKIVAREACVVAGLEVARRVFARLDRAARFPSDAKGLARRDGETVEAKACVLTVEGKAGALLSAERVALNFIQRLSGIATATRRLVERAGGKVAILHTRKTTPGLRALERYAVALGGGAMHRRSLDDQILLKENHFALSGLSIEETVRRARAKVGKSVVVGAEARSHDEARAAIAGGADYLLLDNFSPSELRAEVARLRAEARPPSGGKLVIEASGGIDEENVAEFAASGVDRISSGALTHSARAIDFSLDVEALH